MTDPISHFGRMAQMDSNVRQAAKAEKRPAANEQALAPQSAGTAPVRQDDEVQLSQVARQAMQEPEFDRAKVEAIKTAIQQGQYPLDARRSAENFVALEKMIKG